MLEQQLKSILKLMDLNTNFLLQLKHQNKIINWTL